MTRLKLLLIVLIMVLLFGAAQSFGGGGRGGRGGPVEPPFPDAPASGPASQEVIDELIATVQSADSTLHDKSEALRKLSLVCTKDNIPFLAGLLGDEQLSHMARYALEPLDDPSVDVAFRNALGTLEGSQLVGVIISIGARRDAEAVELLSQLLSNSDAEVAQTSAISLGKIGNVAAAKVLQAAVAKAPDDNLSAICQGLFLCAQSLSSQGQDALAVAIYDQVLKLDTDSMSIRTQALRGAILARKAEGVKLLQQYLQDTDYTLFVAAARASLDMTASGTTAALTDAVAKRSDNNDKILLIGIIGERGDTAALPAILTLVKDESCDKNVRLTAIKVLPQLPNASSVPVLTGLLDNSDSDIAGAAGTAVATVPGQEVDNAVIDMLDSRQTNQRLAAIEMIGRRRITSSIPDLLEAAGGSNQQVRQAALRQIGELGTLADLETLLDLALNLRDSEDLTAAIDAISVIFADAEDPQTYAQKLISRLEQAQPTQKSALLRVLGVVGGTEALSAVRSALNDSNEDIRNAAIQSLSDWPDFEATRPLIDIAANPDTPLVEYVVALRGSARLIRDSSSAPLDERVTLCLAAYDCARRDEERTLVISAMGYLRSTEIGEKLVEIATNNSDLRAVAGQAVISVATSLYTGQVTETAIDRFRQELIADVPSPISFANRMVGGGGGSTRMVTVTDDERLAAQEFAKRIIPLNISDTINTSAQNIVDGNVGRSRGGRG